MLTKNIFAKIFVLITFYAQQVSQNNNRKRNKIEYKKERKNSTWHLHPLSFVGQPCKFDPKWLRPQFSETDGFIANLRHPKEIVIPNEERCVLWRLNIFQMIKLTFFIETETLKPLLLLLSASRRVPRFNF